LAIEKLGYAVSIRTSGQGALNILQSQADAINLVICSMALPDFSGKTLVAKVYEMKADMPVILITEHISGTDLEKFENIGMKLPAASGRGIKADKNPDLYLGGHVVSPQAPLPRVYPTASGWGIQKIIIKGTIKKSIAMKDLATLIRKLFDDVSETK